MLDYPDVPGRTRPNLDKLLRGLCRFRGGDSSPCGRFRSDLDVDIDTPDGMELVKSLIRLAQACASDFENTGLRHEYPNEYLAAASKIRLVVGALGTATGPTSPEAGARLMAPPELALWCQYTVRELVDTYSIDEFATLEIGDDSEPQATM